MTTAIKDNYKTTIVKAAKYDIEFDVGSAKYSINEDNNGGGLRVSWSAKERYSLRYIKTKDIPTSITLDFTKWSEKTCKHFTYWYWREGGRDNSITSKQANKVLPSDIYSLKSTYYDVARSDFVSVFGVPWTRF